MPGRDEGAGMPLKGGGIDARAPGMAGGGACGELTGDLAGDLTGDRADVGVGGDCGGAVAAGAAPTSLGGGADGSSNLFSSPSISPPGDSGAPSGPMKRTFFFSLSEPPDCDRDMELLRGFASFFGLVFGLLVLGLLGFGVPASPLPVLPVLPAEALRVFMEGGDGRSFGGTGGETTGVESEPEGECEGIEGRLDSGPSTPGVATVDQLPVSLVSWGISTEGGALARRPGEPSEGTEGRPRAAASAASMGAEGRSGSTRGSSGTAVVS